MLRVFQVNVGAFLSLREDVQPSQRVLDLQEEVCRCLRVTPPEVVLMTPDGQQMEPAQYIASYTSGTESRPILAFNRAVLQRPHAPQILPLDINDVARAPGLDEAWRKPHALLQLLQGFESQAGQFGSYFGELLVEQKLQVRAWLAVQRNCRGILETFKKQTEGLQAENSCVQSKLGSWRELVLQFPQTLDLLHKVVIPPSLSSGECDMALDEWISQQDPHSSLRNLAEDCRRALNNVFDDNRSEELLRAAQQTSESIEKDSEGIPGWKDRLERLCVYRDELKKTVDAQLELAKNVKTTLENALRSGERTVLDDLKEAQQQTVMVMRHNDRKARELVQLCFKSKQDLAEYLHGRLKGVSDMQRKMAETSKSLVLVREQLKLLRKKMTILCQICEAPQMLVEIMAEIVRRQKFTESFAKMSLSYEQALKEWRAHEKDTRQSFLKVCGDHFLIRLFPAAAEKPGPPRRLELDPAELAGRLVLTLEQAQAALRDLPDGLKESFWTKSEVSLPAALSGVSSISSLGQEPRQQEGAQPREDVEHWVTRLTQEKSELEETVRQQAKGLQELSEERDALRVELDEQREANSELQAARNTAEHGLKSCLSVSVQEEGQRSALVHRTEELEALVVSLQEDKAKLSHQLEEKVASLHAQMELQATDLYEVRAEKERLLAELSQLEQDYSAAAREAVALQEEVEAVMQSHKEVCARNKELERSHSELQVDLDGRSEELRQEQACTSMLRRTLEGRTESLDSLAAALGTLAQEMHALGGSLCAAELQDANPPALVDAKDVSSCVPVVSTLVDKAGRLCRQAVALRATLAEAERSNVDLRAHLEELEDEKRQAKEELEDEKRKQDAERCGTAKVIAGLQGRVSELEYERDQLLREMEVGQVEVLEHLRQSSSQQQEMEEEKKCLDERIQHLQQSVHESEGQRDQLKADLEELQAKSKEMEKELAERCQQHARAVDDLTTEMQRVSQLEVCIAEVEAARGELNKLIAQKDLDHAKALEASLAKHLATEEQHSRDLAKLQAVEEEKVSVESRLKSKEAECALQLEQLAALEALLEKARLDQLECAQTPVQTMEKDMVTKGGKAPLCKTPSEEANLSPRVPTVATSQDLSELEDRTAGPRREKIAVRDLQEGDLALFMAHRPRDSGHSKENYLAFTFDGRLYYLDAECAKSFRQDLTYQSSALGKSSRKTYLGRIRSKTLCEVRKVDNRLGVPVGTKLWKVTAEESVLAKE